MCVGGVRQWPVTVFVHCVRLLVELCVGGVRQWPVTVAGDTGASESRLVRHHAESGGGGVTSTPGETPAYNSPTISVCEYWL